MRKLNRLIAIMILFVLLFANITAGGAGAIIYGNTDDTLAVETPVSQGAPESAGLEVGTPSSAFNLGRQALQWAEFPGEHAGNAQIITRLLDGSGNPYVGVKAVIVADGMAIAEGISDSEGYVTITGLAEGGYRMLVAAADAERGFRDLAWQRNETYFVYVEMNVERTPLGNIDEGTPGVEEEITKNPEEQSEAPSLTQNTEGLPVETQKTEAETGTPGEVVMEAPRPTETSVPTETDLGQAVVPAENTGQIDESQSPVESKLFMEEPKNKDYYYEKFVTAVRYDERKIDITGYTFKDFPIEVTEDNVLIEITGKSSDMLGYTTKDLPPLIRVSGNNVLLKMNTEIYLVMSNNGTGVVPSVIEVTGDNLQITGNCAFTQNHNLLSFVTVDREAGTVKIDDLNVSANIGNRIFNFFYFKQSGTLLVSGYNSLTNFNTTYSPNSTVVTGGPNSDISVIGDGYAHISADGVTTIIGAACYYGFAGVGNIHVKDISIGSSMGIALGIGANGNASVGNITLEGNVSIDAGWIAVGVGATDNSAPDIHASVGTGNGNAISVSGSLSMTSNATMYVGIGSHTGSNSDGNIKGNIYISGNVDMRSNTDYLTLGIGASYKGSIKGDIVLDNAQVAINSPAYVEMGIGADGTETRIDGGVRITNASYVAINTGKQTNVGVGAMGGGHIKADKSIEIDGSSTLSFNSGTGNITAAVGAAGWYGSNPTLVNDIEIGDSVIMSNSMGFSIGQSGAGAAIGNIYIHSGNILQNDGQNLINPKMSKMPLNRFGEELHYYRTEGVVNETIENTAENIGSYLYLGNRADVSGYDEFIGVYLPERIMLPEISIDSGNVITVAFTRNLVTNETTEAEALNTFKLLKRDTKEIIQISTALNGKAITLTPSVSLEDEADAVYEVVFTENIFRDKEIGYLKSGKATNGIRISQKPIAPTGVLTIEKALMDGETDTALPYLRWDESIFFEMEITNGKDFTETVILNKEKPKETINIPAGTYTVTERIVGASPGQGASYTLRSVVYEGNLRTIDEDNESISVTVMNNKVDLPIDHSEQPKTPEQGQQQPEQPKTPEQGQQQPELQEPSGRLAAPPRNPTFIAPPSEILQDIISADMTPAGVPNVYVQVDENQTPLGYISPMLRLGGEPSNPYDYELIEVDEEGIPLDSVSLKVNPKTGDTTSGTASLTRLLCLAAAIFLTLRAWALYSEHLGKTNRPS